MRNRRQKLVRAQRLRRDRPARGDLVQPALGRRPPAPGRAGAPVRAPAPRRLVRRSRAGSCSAAARRRCTPSGWCPSTRPPRASPPSGCARWPGRPTRACWRASSRCRRALRAAERLPDRPAALAATHFPDTEEQEAGARRRLAFEELLLLQLAVGGRRRRRREGRRAAAAGDRRRASSSAGARRCRSSSPATRRAPARELDADLAGERPMQRLLMGEVGSGKTVVALHAMLRAVENGAQAALMAPDRDARRAAPPHARRAARRHGAGRAADRLDVRRAPARAARAARRPASCRWWSARTR